MYKLIYKLTFFWVSLYLGMLSVLIKYLHCLLILVSFLRDSYSCLLNYGKSFCSCCINTYWYIFIFKFYKKVKFFLKAVNVQLPPSKKVAFICFNESFLKAVSNDFYFTIKAELVLNIFKFLSWLFWSCRETARQES